MGLIQCQECGKTISDTTNVCIHCGAPLRDTVETPPTASICEQEKNPTPTSFDALPIAEQNALEKEFLSKDKRALKFRRKRQGLKGIMRCSKLLLILCIFMIIVYFIPSIVQNTVLLNGSMILALFSAIISGIGVFTVIKNKPKPNNDTKKCIYLKRFQAFLTEKNIDYVPVLTSEQERLRFNQVDSTMKL